MGRHKDELWKHVKALDGNRFSCNYCGMSISGGITRIRFHLSGHKGHDIKTCLNVPAHVQKEASQQIQASNNGRENENISTSAPKKKTKRSHQPEVAGACKKDKSEVDKLLAKFLDSNYLSLDVSEIPHLRDLLVHVAEFGPSYELPTYSDLRPLLNNKEIEEYIGRTKKLLNKTGCTLIISKVETNLKLGSLNFFICSPGGWMCLEKVSVSEKGMTFCCFTDNVCRIIESLGPDNVVQVILDDSKDRMVCCFTDFTGDNFFPEVMKVIQRKYAWIYLSRCANGELVVTLQRICLEVSLIHETLQSAKVIFKHVREHHSTLLLRKEQHPRNREYSCSELNEIAIEFFMLNSILQIENGLQALQTPMAPEAIYSTEFWRNGKKVVQVLQPLFQVLELIDGYESTSGFLNEALHRAEVAFKQHIDGKGWRSRVVQPIHEVAGFLNPVYIYMCGQNFCYDYKEIKMVSSRLKLLVPATEWEALLKEVQIYFSKDSALFNTKAERTSKEFHPWKWWEICGDRFPTLQKIAIRILSQTCSTSLCDHITFRQNGLVNESDMNVIMKEKFEAFESKRLEPIDLDKINGLPLCSHEHVQKILEPIDHDKINGHPVSSHDYQKILEDLDGSDNNNKDEVPTAMPYIQQPANIGFDSPSHSFDSSFNWNACNSQIELGAGPTWFMPEHGNNILGSSVFNSKSGDCFSGQHDPNLLPMEAYPASYLNPSECTMPIQPGNGPQRADNIYVNLEPTWTLPECNAAST